jgi:hypothetical protein
MRKMTKFTTKETFEALYKGIGSGLLLLGSFILLVWGIIHVFNAKIHG